RERIPARWRGGNVAFPTLRPCGKRGRRRSLLSFPRKRDAVTRNPCRRRRKDEGWHAELRGGAGRFPGPGKPCGDSPEGSGAASFFSPAPEAAAALRPRFGEHLVDPARGFLLARVVEALLLG